MIQKELEEQIIDIAKQLCDAIKNNASGRIEGLLESGAQPHMRIDYEEYLTPWHWVYSCTDYDTIHILLNAKKINLNFVLDEMKSETVIFGAVLNGRKDIVELLVSYGAELNITNAEGFTPLYTAASKHNSFNILKNLIELGADISLHAEGTPDIISYLEAIDTEHLEVFYSAILNAMESLEENNQIQLLRENLDRLHELSQHHTIPAETLEEIAAFRVRLKKYDEKKIGCNPNTDHKDNDDDDDDDDFTDDTHNPNEHDIHTSSTESIGTTSNTGIPFVSSSGTSTRMNDQLITSVLDVKAFNQLNYYLQHGVMFDSLRQIINHGENDTAFTASNSPNEIENTNLYTPITWHYNVLLLPLTLFSLSINNNGVD